jgi:hypothetical protein
MIMDGIDVARRVIHIRSDATKPRALLLPFFNARLRSLVAMENPTAVRLAIVSPLGDYRALSIRAGRCVVEP